MSKELRQKFLNEIEQADWSMLKAHHERQALFIVRGDVDIIDVALALAMDDKFSIETWLTAKKLEAPRAEEVQQWSQDEHQKLANFLIIQPFVLIQLKLKRPE